MRAYAQVPNAAGSIMEGEGQLYLTVRLCMRVFGSFGLHIDVVNRLDLAFGVGLGCHVFTLMLTVFFE